MQDDQKMEQPRMQPVDSTELQAVEGGVHGGGGRDNVTGPHPIGGGPVPYMEIVMTD